MLSNDKNIKYKRFVEQVFLKCQELQDENDRYVARIIKVKKMIKKRFKETNLLKSRLDRYSDEWRNIRKASIKKELKIRKKKIKQEDSNYKTKQQQNNSVTLEFELSMPEIKARKSLQFVN